MFKVSAKIFDPLGLLGGLPITLKCIFQTFCVDRIRLDDVLQGSYFKQWNDLLKELKALERVLTHDDVILTVNLLVYNFIVLVMLQRKPMELWFMSGVNTQLDVLSQTCCWKDKGCADQRTNNPAFEITGSNNS